jgi:hypothetical protein
MQQLAPMCVAVMLGPLCPVSLYPCKTRLSVCVYKSYPDFLNSPLALTVAGSVAFFATYCHNIAVFIVVLVKCSP